MMPLPASPSRKNMPLLKKSIPGRLCWECVHQYYSPGDAGYSELTPGYAMTLRCSKSYWEFDSYSDQPTLRECLTRAERCADFKTTP
jgi:hypothetical protein